MADVAADVAAAADALGLERFAVLGHSAGGPHALACAALLADRVFAAVSIAGLAPRDADGFDWYAGMSPTDVGALRAAEGGRAARLAHEREPGAEAATPVTPVPADRRAMAGPRSWLETVTGAEAGAGLEGLVDDDVALSTPWGFDAAAITAPVLLLHGDRDPVVPAAHSAWLAARCAAAELRTGAGDGHVSILESAGEALRWLADAG